MALTRTKKSQLINDVANLLSDSKLTIAASYPGTSVKSMQMLRRDAEQGGTTIRVIKNRLFLKALQSTSHLKDLDASPISGQLLYAFNSVDEVAPAQALANFAKQEPQLEFVVGFNADGQTLSAADLQVLANLPSKEQLRAQLVATVAAPLTSLAGVLSGNFRGVLNVLSARSNGLTDQPI